MSAKTTDQKTPTAAAIAKVRRSGATWNATREQLGVRSGSSKFTAVHNAGGGKLDGSGPESQARFHGAKTETR